MNLIMYYYFGVKKRTSVTLPSASPHHMPSLQAQLLSRTRIYLKYTLKRYSEVSNFTYRRNVRKRFQLPNSKFYASAQHLPRDISTAQALSPNYVLSHRTGHLQRLGRP